MKLLQSLKIMGGKSPTGYRVGYEHTDGRIRTTSAFPDFTGPNGGEPAFETLEQAWDMAYKFAATAPNDERNRYCNITVVDGRFNNVSDVMLRKHDWFAE